MKYFTKQFLLTVLVFVLITGLFAMLFSSFEKKEEISLSQLVNEINDGKVSKITVESNLLAIATNDGAKQTSRKES
ncbi:MAG: ATP-dependent metallopeptidase FtsH/Yme1/Tma family protein, partial [Candidatus Spechtbacteria bacterium]|nr:ATP-dependent metallopeptidase FtsH/Yme1/Tma family protein [Candidatus Spechtbacteria bacterium]